MLSTPLSFNTAIVQLRSLFFVVWREVNPTQCDASEHSQNVLN